MDLKYKIAIIASVAVVFFAVGRYTVPVKTKIVTQTVESDDKKTKEKKDSDENKHLKTITVVVTKPDGTKTETTTTTEDSDTKTVQNVNSTDDMTKDTQSTTEVTKGSSRTTLSALAGAKFQLSTAPITPVYGGMISRDILGPISIGAFGLSNGVGGVAIGVSF